MSAWEWCITEDWENPAKGEEWHEAQTRGAVYDAMSNKVGHKDNMWRFILRGDLLIIDYGSHTRFGLVREKEEPHED